jgi:hypothetical protein
MTMILMMMMMMMIMMTPTEGDRPHCVHVLHIEQVAVGAQRLAPHRVRLAPHLTCRE